MRNLTLVATATLALITSDVSAHNEDKPGPHGGYVRMPGAFHTEILIRKNVLEVYLVDFDFKNPTIKNSSLIVMWKQKSTETELTCRSEVDKFICDLPKSFSPKKGALILTAKRDGMVGGLAQYDLPLPNFAKSNTNKVAADGSEHSEHH